MRPVIGPRPRPRRPFKSSGLAFEACGIVNVKAAFVIFDSTYLLNLVAALDWPVLQLPPSRGTAVAKEMAGRARAKAVKKCIV